MSVSVTDSLWAYRTVALKYFVSDFSINVREVSVCISGEVVFRHRHINEPPDIIFSADDDNLEFEPDIEKLTVRPLHYI